jgi:hypothetical protein
MRYVRAEPQRRRARCGWHGGDMAQHCEHVERRSSGHQTDFVSKIQAVKDKMRQNLWRIPPVSRFSAEARRP